MPIISMFYGIIVQHIHVRYAEFTASVDIQTAEVLEGKFPDDN